MKKWTAWIAAVVLAVSAAVCAAAKADGETFRSGAWEYRVLENDTVEIVRYRDNDTDVTIPGELDGRKVTTIGESAFADILSLWTVTIPEGVTSIGALAFSRCESLTEVTIPEGVTEIGAGAFFSCVSLKDITLPGSVTAIGDEAFECCSSLERITIPEGVVSIGVLAFSRCGSLTEIALPDSVQSVGTNPLMCCVSLKEIIVSPDHPYLTVTGGMLSSKPDGRLVSYTFGRMEKVLDIPQGTREIGEGAFEACRFLKSVTIPDSTENIEVRAFFACASLEEITIPAGVTEIGDEAFLGCDSLTVIVSRDSYAAQYCKENGVKHICPDANDY